MSPFPCVLLSLGVYLFIVSLSSIYSSIVYLSTRVLYIYLLTASIKYKGEAIRVLGFVAETLREVWDCLVWFDAWRSDGMRGRGEVT